MLVLRLDICRFGSEGIFQLGNFFLCQILELLGFLRAAISFGGIIAGVVCVYQQVLMPVQCAALDARRRQSIARGDDMASDTALLWVVINIPSSLMHPSLQLWHGCHSVGRMRSEYSFCWPLPCATMVNVVQWMDSGEI
jgi:hypothetical protein